MPARRSRPASPAASRSTRAVSSASPSSSESRMVCVIDCGTSSVRAFLAEIAGSRQRVLEDLTYPVDLTAGFTGGKLDREAMDAVVEAVAKVMEAARTYGILPGTESVRAVATSALREANNSDVLVERLRRAIGVPLEVIDGAEAARLYFEAYRALCDRHDQSTQGNTLLVEIGAGSTCLGFVRQGKLVHSVDEHYGSVRMIDQFRELSDAQDFAITIDRYAIGAARMMLARLPSQTVSNLVFTGGEVRRLVSLLGCETGAPMERIDGKALESWWRNVAHLTPMARAERCSLDLAAAARLLPAAALIRHLTTVTRAEHVLAPHLTLRDGLLADLLPGANGPHHLDHSHLIAEAKQLVSRYGGDLAYAENTASLAVQVFDQTRDLHGLGARERTLLEFAALVHDLGSYINVRNRHKHTMYIIQSVDIAGFTHAEQAVVANIARYHRKSPPEPHHDEFMALPVSHRVVVAYLAAILRLAYGLDVERSQRIRKLRCVVERARLLLKVDRRQIALERWSVGQKSQLFQEVFGLEVVVVPRDDA